MMQLTILLLVATSTLSQASGFKYQLKMAKSREGPWKNVVVKIDRGKQLFTLRTPNATEDKTYTFTKDTETEVKDGYVSIKQLETQFRSGWVPTCIGRNFCKKRNLYFKSVDKKERSKKHYETFKTQILKLISGEPSPPLNLQHKQAKRAQRREPTRASRKDFSNPKPKKARKIADGPPPLPEHVAKMFVGKRQVGVAPPLPRPSDAKRGHDNEEKTYEPSDAKRGHDEEEKTYAPEQARRNRIFCGKNRPKLSFLALIGDNRTKEKPSASKNKPLQRVNTTPPQKRRRREPNTNLLAAINGFKRGGMRRVARAPRQTSYEKPEYIRKLMARGKVMRQSSESSDNSSYKSED